MIVLCCVGILDLVLPTLDYAFDTVLDSCNLVESFHIIRTHKMVKEDSNYEMVRIMCPFARAFVRPEIDTMNHECCARRAFNFVIRIQRRQPQKR